MAHTISALQKDLIAKVQAQREAKRRAQAARAKNDFDLAEIYFQQEHQLTQEIDDLQAELEDAMLNAVRGN